MKKILLLLFATIMISGCSMDYELFYKSKDMIIETLVVGVENEVITDYYESAKDYFTDAYESYVNSYLLNGYEYDIKESNPVSSIKVSKKHDSLNSVINSKIFESVFDEVNVYNQGGNIVLELTDKKVVVDGEFMDEEENESVYNLVLKSNFKIISNADEANNFKGEYKWSFRPDIEDKTIRIEFTDKFNLTAWFCNLNPILIALILISFIGIIGYLIAIFVMKKNKRMNEI